MSRAYAVLAAALSVAIVCGAARAEPVDLAQLTRETQLQFQDTSKLEIIWWVPADIWVAVMSGGDSRDVRKERLQIFDDFLVFFVAEADLTPLGEINFRPEAQTRQTFKLRDTDGRLRGPIAEADIRPDLRQLLDTLRPALASGAGAIGESFRPLVFASRDAAGRRIAAPTQPGEMRVMLGQREFRWRLPLAALLPPQQCPVDGEKLSGAFSYCPYHGVELSPKKAPAAAAPPETQSDATVD